MKKYIFNRILRSLVSLFLVTTLMYTIIFTLVPRKLIFKQDTNYNKMSGEADKKANYENTVFEKMGYINYLDSKELQKAASALDSSVTTEVNSTNEKIYVDYIASKGSGWELHQLPNSKRFYATREIPIYERVVKFYTNLIKIDHPWRIKDKTNPDLERYVRIENDPSIGWAVVGSGTEHKYLVYANSQFPFIHQNIVTLDLGLSYPTFSNIAVTHVISDGQGQKEMRELTLPSGQTKSTTIDIYTRTYKSPSKLDRQEIANFGKGDSYANVRYTRKDPSMLASSAIIGLISLVITYAIGLPWGSYMARFKDKTFDKGSTYFLTFLMAFPSIALLYILRYLLSKVGFPDVFPILGAESALSYLGPAIVLASYGIPGLAIWFRRYLIDQQLSDYVRFARAKGLTEREISNKHIFKNAMVSIVPGIPGAVLSVIVGATLTEKVFAFPGMGKMLIDGISAANNNMVIGLTFIFSALGIVAILLGDILMTMVDPRIKLTNGGGK